LGLRNKTKSGHSVVCDTSRQSAIERLWACRKAGTAAGAFGAFLLTRFLSGLLFGVSALDAGTFLAMAGVIGLVTLLACYTIDSEDLRLQTPRILVLSVLARG
jgi:hypothetical protein